MEEALKYYREAAKPTYLATTAVSSVLQELMGQMDTTMQRAIQQLDVMSATEVQNLYDRLAQRVVDLETSNAATTHFHMVKGAEGSVDLDAECRSIQLGEQLELPGHH